MQTFEGGSIAFVDDSEGKKIIDISNIKIGTSPLIEHIVLVDSLKHNLLSISQLCDKGLRVIFYSTRCNIIDKKNACLLTGYGKNNVLYN